MSMPRELNTRDSPIPSVYQEYVEDSDTEHTDTEDDMDVSSEMELDNEELMNMPVFMEVGRPGGEQDPLNEKPSAYAAPAASSPVAAGGVIVVAPQNFFGAEVEPSEEAGNGANVRGCGAPRTRHGAGRRGGGHGGRGRGREHVANESRPDMLVDFYATYEDVPLDVRERIERLKQEQSRREMRRSNVDAENSDVFHDARSDFVGFCADECACRFDWRPMGSFRGRREPFLVERPGPTRVFQNGYDAFTSIWNTDILEHIALETNRYAAKLALTEARFRTQWYDTNVHEILMLFTFWMMLGIIRMPTIKFCFSSLPLMKTSVFRKLFRENRYWALNRALHFTNVPETEENKLRLIDPILQHLNAKFQALYVPNQNICIDESLTLWKGNLAFRQCIKTKAAKLGIKSYELCESSTGYLWSFFVYAGKNSTEGSLLQKSTDTVLKLLTPLLGKGHTLFLDNWFNSPLLARFLKRNKTDCVGTLRRNQRDIPLLLKETQLTENSFLARHSDDVVVIALQDKKPVLVISTYHDTSQVLTQSKPQLPSKYKLSLINDYNLNMGGVDKMDHMLEGYLLERKRCSRWYKKLFKRLLNVSVLNSRVLVEKSQARRMHHLEFRLQLIEDLINHHLNLVAQPEDMHVRRVASSTEFPVGRIISNNKRFHALRRIERTSVEAGERRTVLTSGGYRSSKDATRCGWCHKRENKRRKTVYECSICEYPLCLGPCFIKFHTLR